MSHAVVEFCGTEIRKHSPAARILANPAMSPVLIISIESS